MKSGDLCKILMACIGASVPKTTSNHLWMTYLQMCIVRLRNITEPITFCYAIYTLINIREIANRFITVYIFTLWDARNNQH